MSRIFLSFAKTSNRNSFSQFTRASFSNLIFGVKLNNPEQTKTEALLAAAKQNPSDVGPLFEHYRPYLTLLTRIQIGRRLRGKADAADVVQDTFLDAYRQFPGFRGDTTDIFAGWLRRILAGQIAGLIRRYCQTQARDVNLERTLEHELDSSSDRIVYTADTGTSPSDAIVRKEELIRLANALEQLPSDYREAVLFRQIEGLPFADIAAKMGRTEDSVQKLWVRGLETLRQELHVRTPPPVGG